MEDISKLKMISSNLLDQTIDEASLKAEKRAIGETLESRIKGLKSLRNKLQSVDDFKSRLDDEFLLRFLRISKFDTKKAYERIRKYYSVRKTYSHVLRDFYPSAAKTALGMGHLLVSPCKSADQGIVFIFKRGMYNPSTMVYEDVFLMDCLVLDYLSQNPLSQICGIHAILDMAGYGFQHFCQDTPRRVRMGIDTMQNSFPLRYRSIHVVNAPQIFTFLYNLCYPFMTAKIRKRLCLHNGTDWKSLHSALPPEVLPVEYGGTIPHSELIDLTEKVAEKESEFKEQLQYGFVQKS